MSQYLCLFSLILQGLHEEGECRQLEFWAGKGANIRDLFCTAPKVLKLHESHFWINKKYWRKNQPEGAHTLATRVGGAPYPLGAPPASWATWQASGAHLLLYEVFYPGKRIISKLTGQNSAATRRNLGGTNLGLRRSCSARETSLWEGEIITIIITNDPLVGRGSISINIFTSTISSQTLLHLLYPIFVPKPQIGTCRLRVVLITPCS